MQIDVLMERAITHAVLADSFTELLFKAAAPDRGPWPVPSHNFHDAWRPESLFGDGQEGIRLQAILCIGVLRLAYLLHSYPEDG